MRKSKASKVAKARSPLQPSAPPREKVGIIFECGPSGSDVLVCRHLVQMMDANVEIEIQTLDNKPNLCKDCAESARILLNQGCTRVIILWDLYPSKHGSQEKPCLHNDRVEINQALDAAGLTDAPIYMVCIHNEMEVWLLKDARALAGFFTSQTPTHPVHERDVRVANPEQLTNPKTPLHTIFRKYRGRRYSDVADAPKIIRNLPDLTRLRQDPSFKRFEEKIIG